MKSKLLDIIAIGVVGVKKVIIDEAVKASDLAENYLPKVRVIDIEKLIKLLDIIFRKK